MKVQATVGSAQDEESMGLFTVEELREVISVKVLAGQESPDQTDQHGLPIGSPR